MIEAIFHDNSKAQSKLEHGVTLLRNNYYKSSDFSKLVSVEDALIQTSELDKDFEILYFRHPIPKEWFTRDDILIDLAFGQFGANLAFSETHYIINKVFNEPRIKRTDITANVRDLLLSEINSFSVTNKLDAMLSPIDLFVDMHVKWITEKPDNVKMDFISGDLSFNSMKPSMFYSNVYMPYSDFVLIDRRFAKWTSSPNYKNRLDIKISESTDEKNIDLLFLVRLKFKIVQPEKALILHRDEKPENLEKK